MVSLTVLRRELPSVQTQRFKCLLSGDGVLNVETSLPFAPQIPKTGSIRCATWSHSHRHDFICPIKARVKKVKAANKEPGSCLAVSTCKCYTPNIFEGEELCVKVLLHFGASRVTSWSQTFRCWLLSDAANSWLRLS